MPLTPNVTYRRVLAPLLHKGLVDSRLSVGGCSVPPLDALRAPVDHAEVPAPSRTGFKNISTCPLHRPEPEEGGRAGSRGDSSVPGGGQVNNKAAI